MAPVTDCPPPGTASCSVRSPPKFAAPGYVALRAANAEVIALNWRIGRLILRRQAQEGWGARVITLLSHRAQ